MGSTFLGDIMSGATAEGVISHASLASNGATASYQGAGGATKFRAPQNIVIVDAWWEPHGADQTASQAATYRLLKLVNGSLLGTGTVVLASLAMSASLASDTQRAMTLATTPSVSKGEVVLAAQVTVGGDHSQGTVVQAGQFRFAYRPI